MLWHFQFLCKFTVCFIGGLCIICAHINLTGIYTVSYLLKWKPFYHRNIDKMNSCFWSKDNTRMFRILFFSLSGFDLWAGVEILANVSVYTNSKYRRFLFICFEYIWNAFPSQDRVKPKVETKNGCEWTFLSEKDVFVASC